MVALVEEEEEIVSYCSGDDGERERDTRWPRNGCRRFSAIFVPRAGVPFLILCMGYARRSTIKNGQELTGGKALSSVWG